MRLLHQPTLRKAKMDLKAGKIKMAEFMIITKRTVRNMKEVMRCLEDFELFYVVSASKELASFDENNCGGVAPSC